MARAVIITSYLEHPLMLSQILREDDYIVCLDGGYDIAREQGIRPHLLLGDFDSISDQGAPHETPAKPAASQANPTPIFDADEVLRYPPEKDYTDLELALRLLDPAKTPELVIIGGLGGRLDQTLVNVQMLDRYTAGSRPTEHAPSESSHDDRCGSGSTCHEDATDGTRYGSFHVYSRIEILDGHHRAFIAYGTDSEGSGDDSQLYEIPEEPGCYLSLLPLTPACSGVSLAGVKYPLSEAVLYKGASLGISNEFEASAAVLRIRSGRLLVMVTRGNGQDTL